MTKSKMTKEEGFEFPGHGNFIVHKTTGRVGMSFAYASNSGKCEDCGRAKPESFILLDGNKNLELCMICLQKSFIPVSF